jgi:hypothetical protein
MEASSPFFPPLSVRSPFTGPLTVAAHFDREVEEYEEHTIFVRPENPREDVLPPLVPTERPQRPERARKVPDMFQPAIWPAYAMAAVEVLEPTTLEEGLAGDVKTKWHTVWRDEVDSLETNHTWELVELPVGRTAIG